MINSQPIKLSELPDISMTNFYSTFEKLDDPRGYKTRKYALSDIVGLVLIASICGCDNFVSIAAFANDKKEWLGKYVNLDCGIPSHDTLSRVFSMIDPDQFSLCLAEWSRKVSCESNLINIDGKTNRVSRSDARGLKPVHIVTAWVNESGISLGDLACDREYNEISKSPEVLDLLHL